MKNSLTIGIILLFIALLSFSSCEKIVVGEIKDSSNENNFQLLWDKFDTHYGLFFVNDVDWNAVYVNHLPQAQAAKNDQELFTVLSSMLRVLDDQHVNLYTNNPLLADFNSGHNGPLPAREDFLFKNILDNYLIEYHEENENFGYGKLSTDIGYIHVSSQTEGLSFYKKAMDKALNDLASTKKIIFDIRDHNGGDDNVSKYIAGRFATSKNLFMTSKKRNGPEHNDFEKTLEWYVEPEGGSQYTKPVILLTTKRSISAAETLTFAMREIDYVIHMGDTTAGAFSDVVAYQLYNGWLVTISVGDYRGSDGKSYEGNGIAPQIYSKNLKADVLEGTDKTLEEAMKL